MGHAVVDSQPFIRALNLHTGRFFVPSPAYMIPPKLFPCLPFGDAFLDIDGSSWRWRPLLRTRVHGSRERFPNEASERLADTKDAYG